MRKFSLYGWVTGLLLTLSLLNCFALCHAATTSGSLTEDEIWSGTINLTGDVTVPEGLTLTIEPGTEVVFPAKADDTAGGYDSSITELIVNGSLVAVGTEDSPILFKSGAFFDAKGDWGGIHAAWGLGFKTFRMEHCVIEYASTGIEYLVSSGVQSATISNCIIRESSGDGISITAESESKVSVTVTDNEITDNDGRGLYGYANGTNTELAGSVSGNTISNNGGNGIYIYNYSNGKSELTIGSNIIHGNNTYGIHLNSYSTNGNRSRYTISDNTVYASGTGIYGYTTYSCMSVSLTDNEIYQNTDGIYFNIYNSGSSNHILCDDIRQRCA